MDDFVIRSVESELNEHSLVQRMDYVDILFRQ